MEACMALHTAAAEPDRGANGGGGGADGVRVRVASARALEASLAPALAQGADAMDGVPAPAVLQGACPLHGCFRKLVRWALYGEICPLCTGWARAHIWPLLTRWVPMLVLRRLQIPPTCARYDHTI